MPAITRHIHKPLLALGTLAVLTGLATTSCASLKPEAAGLQPIAVTNSAPSASEKASTSENAQGEPNTATKQTRSVSAAEAGEDTYAVKDHSSISFGSEEERQHALMMVTEGECAMRWQAACAVPVEIRRQRALAAPTDVELTNRHGYVLPRVIPGMIVGMPYSQARFLILNEGWRPADGLEAGNNNNGLDHYPEVEMCSGTGLGLCNMSFVDAEMNRFGVTTGGTGPVVMEWGDVW